MRCNKSDEQASAPIISGRSTILKPRLTSANDGPVILRVGAFTRVNGLPQHPLVLRHPFIFLPDRCPNHSDTACDHHRNVFEIETSRITFGPVVQFPDCLDLAPPPVAIDGPIRKPCHHTPSRCPNTRSDARVFRSQTRPGPEHELVTLISCTTLSSLVMQAGRNDIHCPESSPWRISGTADTIRADHCQQLPKGTRPGHGEVRSRRCHDRRSPEDLSGNRPAKVENSP